MFRKGKSEAIDIPCQHSRFFTPHFLMACESRRQQNKALKNWFKKRTNEREAELDNLSDYKNNFSEAKHKMNAFFEAKFNPDCKQTVLERESVPQYRQKIGECEFFRRRIVIEETVKSPFFNFWNFKDGQERRPPFAPPQTNGKSKNDFISKKT